jgi:hypothetical protein
MLRGLARRHVRHRRGEPEEKNQASAEDVVPRPEMMKLRTTSRRASSLATNPESTSSLFSAAPGRCPWRTRGRPRWPSSGSARCRR